MIRFSVRLPLKFDKCPSSQKNQTFSLSCMPLKFGKFPIAKNIHSFVTGGKATWAQGVQSHLR